MLKFSSFLFILSILFGTTQVRAQSFGFGCLGLVGGYGGYTYQIYQPAGLNSFIAGFNELRGDSLSSSMAGFGKAQGFRVGLNLYRANLDGLILTAKGFYQLLLEKNGAIVESSFGTTSSDFEVSIKSWGVGFDLGTSITKTISWKVIDAALLFNSTDFSVTNNFPGAVTDVRKYSSDSKLGYSLGTGFILSLIDEYVSLEGLVAYSALSVDTVIDDEGIPFYSPENSDQPITNFIEAGGFSAVIQLNLSLPL